MAVTRYQAMLSRYLGLSSDNKPAAAEGSEFLETDTGDRYICTDGTTWGKASDFHIGEVGGNTKVVTLTLTPHSADALDAGDVAFATQEIPLAARAVGKAVLLHSLVLSDIADQKAALEIIFFNANTSLGTEDSAPDIDDTEVLTVIGRVSIAATDWLDLGGSSICCKTNIGLLLQPTAASTSLWVAGICTGTPTFAANALQAQFGLMRD